MFLATTACSQPLWRLKCACWGSPIRAENFEQTAPLSMLMSMQALPGRQSREMPDVPVALVTRTSAHADQRRRILRAAGELIAKRGYSDVTVELIVKRAHCSYKTYYKHFENKEDCCIAVFESALAYAERTIRERLDAEELPWAEQVVLALRTLVELILAEPLISRAVIVEAPTIGLAITERYEQATKALAPLFRPGRDLNPRGAELPDSIDDTLAGSVFWSAYRYLIVSEAEGLAAYLPVMIELVLRTYLGQAEAARIARDEDSMPDSAVVRPIALV
jgi:AcrR family transcriptional regulator